MNRTDFNDLTAELMKHCDEILIDRAEAYAADEDRLENFKQISMLTGVPAPMVALVLQAKHMVALAKAVSERRYNKTKEYITDIINYQRLLYALIEERQKQAAQCNRAPIVQPGQGPEGYIHTLKRPESPQ